MIGQAQARHFAPDEYAGDLHLRCLFVPHKRAGLDSHQQRLRFSDLGHFRRRREAFERRRKNGIGVGEAVG